MINQQLINEYVFDTKNPVKCYNLALAYYRLDHYAEAVSYFLKAAENSQGDIRYNSLIHIHFCYRQLGGRSFTLNSILKHAIANFPDRPEAYYHLAKLCEKEGANVDGYMWSNIGLSKISNINTSFEFLELNGDYDLLFLKAHFAWMMDKPTEARETYQYILKNCLKYLEDHQVDYLRSQLLKFGMAPEWKTIQKYDKDNKYHWIYRFDGIDSISHNHSQALQDMFVLYSTNGKRNGTYLEIGSAYPYYTNNTALLEQFGWTGLGIDNNEGFVKNYNEHRKNKSILANALELDYEELLKNNYNTTDIDYLQIDIKTSEETFNVLRKIPLDKYRFAVITYEHDDYVDTTQSYKRRSRDYLWALGYRPARYDVSPIDGFSFEDWWIHPSLIPIERAWSMNRLANLEWGDLPAADRDTIYREIQLERVYDYWRKIKDGDVVVDIGANIGAFSVTAISKKLKHLHVVECSQKYLDICRRNISNLNQRNNSVTYHNVAIGKDSNSKINSFGSDEIQIVSFKDFINTNNIPYIDYLKIDAEGAEYDIFIDENIHYLKNNVMYIAAEFHFHYPGNREQWKVFRDKYLKFFPDRKIISCTTQSIVPGQMINLESYLNDDNFVDSYPCQFMVFINNDRTSKEA